MRLALQDITKDFPAGRVLHGVSMELEAGHVHAVVGENGAGKSTLMKVVAGVYPDYGGTVSLDGRVVHMASPRASLEAGVAVIHQEFALVPDLTVAENIALGRELRGRVPGILQRRRTLERSAAEAAALGIDLKLDVLVSGLPVDQQQLVEIVKAVARDARVLIMDEPTARLTSDERERLFGIIDALRTRGVGIIYISHFLEEIFSVAQTVTVLRDGRAVSTMPLDGMSVAELARSMVGKEAAPLAAAATERRHFRVNGTPAPCLELRGVGVPGVLDTTSLTVGAGEIVALAGLPSSARSVLARCLVGEQARAVGSIAIDDIEHALPRNPSRAARAGVAMLPADRKNAGILASRPVSDNLALSALRSHLARAGVIRRSARRKVVADLITSLGVRVSTPDQPMRLVSGGNQQKVLLGRALAARPRILLLDQPTVGVDVGAKAEIYEQIVRVAESGVAVLLVSDDLEEILVLADSICIVRGPRVSPPVPNVGIDRAQLLAAMTSDRDQLDAGVAGRAVEPAASSTRLR